jgi:WhiB family redox-sensing transcriptional regulator
MQEQLAERLAASAYPGARRTNRRTWRRQGNCARFAVNLSIFFSHRARDQQAARKVCQGCPSVVNCLEAALAMPFRPPGIWGGTSQQDRGRLIGKALKGLCQHCGDPVDEWPRFKFCPACRDVRLRARNPR